MKLRTHPTIGSTVLAGIILVAALGRTGMGLRPQKAGAPNAPLLDRTFDNKTGSWIAFGSGGQVRYTPDAARAKNGKPALALDYKIEHGQFAAAVLPVSGGALAQMKLLKFWIKTDSATGVAVLLSEKKPEGGNYTALI